MSVSPQLIGQIIEYTLKIMTIKTVLFDMDGVVIDSEKLHLKAMGLTLEQNGIVYPETMLAGFVGKSDRSFFEHARDHLDDRVDVDKFLEGKDALFNSFLPDMQFVDGFLPFAQFIQSKGIATALVTSSSHWTVNQVDELLGTKKWFNLIVAEEDTVKHKPDPAPYLLALEKLKAATDTTLIIEDSINGIISGKAAGCLVCGMTTSFDKQTLLDAGADKAFDTYEELKSTFF